MKKTSSEPKQRMGRSQAFGHETYLLALLVIEWIYFYSAGHGFGTVDNAFDLLRHSAEIGLLAVAMTPVILTGGIDLSVGSLMGLCAVLFGKLWRDAQLPIAWAIPATLALGCLGGFLNAALITRANLPPLIVTLATFSLFRGLAEAITRGVDAFTGFPDSFLQLGQGQWVGMPRQFPVFAAVTLMIWLLVHRTTLGRSWRVLGFNSEAAVFAGLPVKRQLTIAYLLTGTIAALAAVLYTSRLGQAKADAGTGYELLAITAVVLGGTSIFGGTGSVHGTLMGVAAIAVLNNGLVHIRQPREVAGMLTGLLLIGALTLPILMRRIAQAVARRAPRPQ